MKQALQTFAKKDRAGKFPKLKELNDIFEDLDLDGDGHVSYDEVCEYIVACASAGATTGARRAGQSTTTTTTPTTRRGGPARRGP